MFKTALISTIFAVAASQAVAGPATGNDVSMLPADVAARVIQLQQYGDRYQRAIDAIFAEHAKPAYTVEVHEYDFSMLSEETAARVKDLMKYGSRFDAAIRAIFAEAVKPDWTFGDTSRTGDTEREANS